MSAEISGDLLLELLGSILKFLERRGSQSGEYLQNVGYGMTSEKSSIYFGELKGERHVSPTTIISNKDFERAPKLSSLKSN